MVFQRHQGDPQLTSVTKDLIEPISAGLLAVIDRADLRNASLEPPPPLTTWESVVQFLTTEAEGGRFDQRRQEAWYMDRTGIRHDALTLGTSDQYYQMHQIPIVGLVWRKSFEASYNYIQEKTDKILLLMEVNKNLLQADDAELFEQLGARFQFGRFGEQYMQRVDIAFRLTTLINDTRVITGGR